MSSQGSTSAPVDRGAQSERTALSWRRTSLALLVGTLLVARFTLDTLGPVILLPAVVTCAAAAWGLVVSSRSRRLTMFHPTETEFRVLSDGTLPAVVAAVAGALALGEIVSAITILIDPD